MTPSHSQNQEQQHILKAFEGRPIGRFLDIGAWHPVIFSNTRALYELGWGGVMVEPSPIPFEGLLAEYCKGRDAKIASGAGSTIYECGRIKLIQAAVVLSPAVSVMLHVTDDAVSTLSPALYEKWKGVAKFTGTRAVDAITLEAIVADHGPFDFINLDAEGLSVDLFIHRVLVLDPMPRCICVEYDESLAEILSRATGLGYSATYVSGENVVLVR